MRKMVNTQNNKTKGKERKKDDIQVWAKLIVAFPSPTASVPRTGPPGF